MRHRLVLALALSVSSVARGQGAPGTNLTVDVAVSAITVRGDTTGIHYRLRNHRDSREELFTFTVDAPAPVTRIPRPQPRAEWMVGTDYRGRSVADWAALGHAVLPGAESPDLFFEAVGLPAVVTSWVRGYYPPPPLTAADTNPLVRPSDPLRENSVLGRTVGVEPFPADRTPRGLFARLRVLTDSACGLGWIIPRGVCRELTERLRAGERELERGRRAEAQDRLRGFVEELTRQHGRESGEQHDAEEAGRERARKHVNDSAYWLLSVNAQYLLSHL